LPAHPGCSNRQARSHPLSSSLQARVGGPSVQPASTSRIRVPSALVTAAGTARHAAGSGAHDQKGSAWSVEHIRGKTAASLTESLRGYRSPPANPIVGKPGSLRLRRAVHVARVEQDLVSELFIEF